MPLRRRTYPRTRGAGIEDHIKPTQARVACHGEHASSRRRNLKNWKSYKGDPNEKNSRKNLDLELTPGVRMIPEVTDEDLRSQRTVWTFSRHPPLL